MTLCPRVMVLCLEHKCINIPDMRDCSLHSYAMTSMTLSLPYRPQIHSAGPYRRPGTSDMMGLCAAECEPSICMQGVCKPALTCQHRSLLPSEWGCPPAIREPWRGITFACILKLVSAPFGEAPAWPVIKAA